MADRDQDMAENTGSPGATISAQHERVQRILDEVNQRQNALQPPPSSPFAQFQPNTGPGGAPNRMIEFGNPFESTVNRGFEAQGPGTYNHVADGAAWSPELRSSHFPTAQPLPRDYVDDTGIFSSAAATPRQTSGTSGTAL